jgi:hypothetical protein
MHKALSKEDRKMALRGLGHWLKRVHSRPVLLAFDLLSHVSAS